MDGYTKKVNILEITGYEFDVLATSFLNLDIWEQTEATDFFASAYDGT